MKKKKEVKFTRTGWTQRPKLSQGYHQYGGKKTGKKIKINVINCLPTGGPLLSLIIWQLFRGGGRILMKKVLERVEEIAERSRSRSAHTAKHPSRLRFDALRVSA